MTVKELLNKIQNDLDEGNLSLDDEVKLVSYYKEAGWYQGYYVTEDIDYAYAEVDDKAKKFFGIHL